MRSGYGFLTYDQDNMKNMIFWFYPFDIFQSIFYTFLKQYFHVFKSILTKIHENDKPSENDNFKKIDILVIFFFVEFKIFLDVFPFFRIDFFDVSFFFHDIFLQISDAISLRKNRMFKPFLNVFVKKING